jgi:alpha-beta hydrolase superfamily lysophospholipase
MDASLTTPDGLALQLREWPHEGGAARGTVLIVHGLGEHIGRYEHVAAMLVDAGWNVVGFDQRGHGRSDGGRGLLEHADSMLTDLALVVDATRRAYPGRLVLLGHSMGGLTAARFVAGGVAPSVGEFPWHRRVDGLVLSAPALNAGMSSAQRLLLGTIGPLAPNIAVNNGLQAEWLSRDPKVVAAYRADPLVHDRISPRLTRFIVDGGHEVIARAPHWDVPTLLLYPGADRCVSPAGSAAFAANAPPQVVTTRVWPALFHEIFNEPEQDEVFSVLREWLDRLAG